MKLGKFEQYQNQFMNPEYMGAYQGEQVKPQVQPINKPVSYGGLSEVSGYNPRIHGEDLSQVVAGINTDTRNSNFRGEIGVNMPLGPEEAMYINGGRVGGALNLLS